MKGGLSDAEYAQSGGVTFTAFLTIDESTPSEVTGSPVFVDVFDGSTEKFVCGDEPAYVAGIAADASGTYVAYVVGSVSSTSPETVIARVP